MLVIGLTGGIASGKSLVADLFHAQGIPVIDTDVIARQVVAPGHPVWRRLFDAFPDAFLADGTLDRAALAHRVFSDPAARATLEAITHPAIFDEVDRQLAALRDAPTPPPIALVVVPLLFEVGAEGRFDATILVEATPEQQRHRLVQLRGYSVEAADARIAAQWPLEAKRARADYLLDNTGPLDAVRANVEAVTRQLLRRAANQ